MIIDTGRKPPYTAPFKIHVAFAIQNFLVKNNICISAPDRTRVDKAEYYQIIKKFCFQHPDYDFARATGIESRELFVYKNMIAFMLFTKEYFVDKK